MAESLGEAFIEVLADTSPFGEGLEDGISGALAGVEDEVAGALDGVGDAAAGAFDGIGDAAAGAADDVGEAFDGVGDTIAGEVASGVEEAESTLGGFTDALGSIQGALATAAGGAGLEGFARSQQDATLSVQRGAERMGETEDAVRDMIDGITDWTFSSADAAEGMELLNQRGVTNMDTIEDLLPVWDDFADATGQDFVQAMDDGQRALGAFGVPAEEAGEHIDTLTFMANEVGVPMDRLARQVRGNEEELDALGIGLDESAGLLAALGAQGMDGRDAVALFGREIGNADGDLDGLLDALGLTADEFAEYTGNVQDAEGITSAQADQANALATPMERLGGFTQNLAFRFGDFGEAAGAVAAPLGALGPAMFGVNQVGATLAKVLPGLGGALSAVGGAFRALGTTILANPLFLIAAVVVGIIAVIYIFRDEIIEVLGAAFDWLRDAAGTAWEFLSGIVEGTVEAVVGFVTDLRDRVVDFFTDLFDGVVDLVGTLRDTVVEFFTDLVDTVVSAVSGWVSDLVGFVQDLWDDYVRIVTGIRDSVAGFFTDLVDTVVTAVSGWVSDLVGFAQGLWDDYRRIVTGIRNSVVEFIAGMVSTVVSTVSGWVSDLVRFVTGLRDDYLRIVSGLRDSVVEFFTGLVSTVVETVSGWVSDVVGFVTDLKDDFSDTVSDMIDDVLDFFLSFPSDVLSALGDLGTLLVDAGKDLVQGLIDGVKDMAKRAASAVSDVASGMVSSVTSVFRSSSPSQVFADIGGDVVDGLTLGVERNADDALRSVTDLANDMVQIGMDSDGRAVAASRSGVTVGGVREVRQDGDRSITVNVSGEVRPIDEERLATLLRRQERLEGVL